MADLSVHLPGLTFKNPILPGAGPNVDGGAEIAAAAAGGAGGLVSRTLSLRPQVPTEPSLARVTRDTFIHRQHGSARPFRDWVDHEFPLARAAARAHGLPLIASVGYSPDEVRRLGPQLQELGADAIELCLHETPREQALPTAQALRAAVRLPVIVKLSPHLGEDLADLAAELEPYADAFTCVGSFGPTLALDVETGGAALGAPLGIGYLSGASIRPMAQRFVFEVARRVARPVIACGGVSSARDAIEMLMVGASAVQVCSHALVHGPAVYGQIAAEMDQWLSSHGYSSVAAVTGAYIRKYGHGQRVVLEKEETPELAPDKCIKCTICGQVCFYDAIVAPPKQLPALSADPCFECGLCVSACPTGALTFRPRDVVTMLPAPGTPEV